MTYSLRAVCAREFDLQSDETEQTSDWSRCPLTESQVTYAALDADVLVTLRKDFLELGSDQEAGYQAPPDGDTSRPGLAPKPIA